MEAWLKCLRDAKKSCFIENGKKKVLYKLEDGREMAEEYNMDTNLVSRRAWKVKRTFAGEPEWEVELGDFTGSPMDQLDSLSIKEISSAPMISKRITRASIEWRIRNLPYPIEVYTVTADEEGRCITVRTSNKKYFKKIPVPDLDRLGLPVEQDPISVSHKFNTLIISYKKPAELNTLEKLVLEEINCIETTKESAVQCPTS